MAKKTKTVGGVTNLDQHDSIKVGDIVAYRDCEWTVLSIKRGLSPDGTPAEESAPVAFEIEWASGDLAGARRITVGSHCVKRLDLLDAIAMSAPAPHRAKEKPPGAHELDAIDDPRRVCTQGRLFIRPTHDMEGSGGTKIKRAMIAGVVIGDIGVGGDGEWPEDELWMCDVIVLRPIQKYRGFKEKGATIERALLGDGLQPHGFDTPLKD